MDAQAAAGTPRAFHSLPDPRRHNVRHKFLDIITIAFFAIISGCDDWYAVAAYGRSKFNWLATFLGAPRQTPGLFETFDHGDPKLKVWPNDRQEAS